MLIGEIQKNSTEKIQVSTASYKGHNFIDVRVYYEDDNGEWRPTKKGITIAPEKVDDLVNLIKKAKEAIGIEECPSLEGPMTKKEC
jgi:hypothetical protein